jgi:hypothetical protein
LPSFTFFKCGFGGPRRQRAAGGKNRAALLTI